MELFFLIFAVILKAFLFFSALLGSGYFVLSQCFPESDHVRRWAASPIVGIGIACIWLNVVGRYLSWGLAVYVWVSLGCLSTYFFYKKRIHREFIGFSRKKCLTVGVLFLSFLFLALVGGIFDENWHFPLAGLIAHGHWPAKFLFNPDLPLVYHLAFDLVVAGLGSVGLWIPLASDILTAVSETSLVVLAYFFVEEFFADKWKRFGAVMLWWCAGSFGWMVRPWRVFLPEVLASVPPFVSTVGNSVGLLVNTKSQIFAFGFFVTVLVFRKHFFSIDWKKALFFAVGTATMAFSSETFFVFFVPCLYAAFFFQASDRRSRAYWLSAAVITATVASMQGGLITDAVKHIFGSADTVQTAYTSFLVRTSSQLRVFGGELNLYSGWAWVRLLLEWGMQAILFIIFWLHVRRRSSIERWLTLGVLLSFLFPFIVVYPASPHDTLRMWGNAFFVTNLFGAIYLLQAVFLKKLWVGIVIFGSLGGCLSIALSQIPVISWMAPTRPQVVSTAFWSPFLYQQDRLPLSSNVWLSVSSQTYEEDQALVHQLPIVFGVYAKVCRDIYHDLQDVSTSPECDAFYTAPSQESLDRLNVTHLLLNKQWEDLHKDEAWFSRTKLIKRFEPSYWTNVFLRLWSLDTSSYALYELKS